MPTALPWRFLSIVAVGFLRLAPRLQFITSSHERIIFYELDASKFKKKVILKRQVFATVVSEAYLFTTREILLYSSPLIENFWTIYRDLKRHCILFWTIWEGNKKTPDSYRYRVPRRTLYFLMCYFWIIVLIGIIRLDCIMDSLSPQSEILFEWTEKLIT